MSCGRHGDGVHLQGGPLQRGRPGDRAARTSSNRSHGLDRLDVGDEGRLDVVIIEIENVIKTNLIKMKTKM